MLSRVVIPAGVRKRLSAALWRSYPAQARVRPPGFIFILGHMRSGSTLLVNILCSHPRVRGFGETRLVYRSPADLDHLVAYTHRVYDSLILRPYVLDKLLHDHYLPDPAILSGRGTRFVFLLREPARTIPSTMHLMGWPAETATAYYAGRLRTLGDLAERYSEEGRSVLLTYDELTRRTEAALGWLTERLALSPPLRPEYRLPPLRGFGVGDPSVEGRGGRVAPRDSDYGVAVPEGILAEAQAAFDAAHARLATLCDTLPPAAEAAPRPVAVAGSGAPAARAARPASLGRA